MKAFNIIRIELLTEKKKNFIINIYTYGKLGGKNNEEKVVLYFNANSDFIKQFNNDFDFRSN